MIKKIRQIEPYFWFSDGTPEYEKGYYYKQESSLIGPFKTHEEAKEAFKNADRN